MVGVYGVCNVCFCVLRMCVCVRKGIPGSGQVGSGRPRSPVTMSSALCPLKWDHWEYNLSLLTLYTVGKWQNSHINTSDLFLKEGTKQSWIKIKFYFRQGKGFESIHYRHICWVLICNRLCVCCKWMRDPPWYPRTYKRRPGLTNSSAHRLGKGRDGGHLGGPVVSRCGGRAAAAHFLGLLLLAMQTPCCQFTSVLDNFSKSSWQKESSGNYLKP